VVSSARKDAERRAARLFQSPSLRGSGLFLLRLALALALHLGVSIPFIAGQWSLREARRRACARRHVSIPFIAGQWSLRESKYQRTRPRRSFNPLHCGAVVSSLWEGLRRVAG